ncbi:hypothetical protein SRB5_52910 [Streptomyces sp. RB5]|uniref:Uncharacterized protein n=1 Tax=Streptomyces smaragdinus TaxID=2585196 RepID=A0A7K0CP85_9ACTN|nr:hypothetical protein [Streptomyces smaragdinus]
MVIEECGAVGRSSLLGVRLLDGAVQEGIGVLSIAAGHSRVGDGTQQGEGDLVVVAVKEGYRLVAQFGGRGGRSLT